MGKFAQLGFDFFIQERNWIKGGMQSFKPKGCVDSLEVLKAHLLRKVDSSTDYIAPVADLDFDEFNKLVQWLPAYQRKVYIAENIRSYISPKSGFIRFIPKDRSPWDFLGLSKHTYERVINEAIRNIKHHGGLV